MVFIQRYTFGYVVREGEGGGGGGAFYVVIL